MLFLEVVMYTVAGVSFGLLLLTPVLMALTGVLAASGWAVGLIDMVAGFGMPGDEEVPLPETHGEQHRQAA